MANFKKHLPSKRFQYILLAVLIIIGGFFFFGGKKKDKSGNLPQKGPLSAMFLKQDAIDSDGDGLKDWEETLWKTDPQNRDTDEDETPDGEEVQVGRDPVKPGPDDKLSERLIPIAGENQASESETESLSKRFFAEYLSLKKEGNLDQAAKDNLIDSFVENLPEGESADAYEISDLALMGDNSYQTLESYGNKLRAVIIEHSGASVESDASIISRVMKSEDDGFLEDLQENISLYEDTLADLKILKVPSDVAKDQLALMNSIADIKKILEEIMQSPKDPVLALAALKRYPQTGEDVVVVLRDIQGALQDAGVYVSLDTL